jgi:hypothetical protein
MIARPAARRQTAGGKAFGCLWKGNFDPIAEPPAPVFENKKKRNGKKTMARVKTFSELDRGDFFRIVREAALLVNGWTPEDIFRRCEAHEETSRCNAFRIADLSPLFVDERALVAVCDVTEEMLRTQAEQSTPPKPTVAAADLTGVQPLLDSVEKAARLLITVAEDAPPVDRQVLRLAVETMAELVAFVGVRIGQTPMERANLPTPPDRHDHAPDLDPSVEADINFLTAENLRFGSEGDAE